MKQESILHGTEANADLLYYFVWFGLLRGSSIRDGGGVLLTSAATVRPAGPQTVAGIQ